MFALKDYVIHRELLIDAIVGIDMLYSKGTIARQVLRKKLATESGGFSQEWKWDRKELGNLSDEELWHLYYACKEAKV